MKRNSWQLIAISLGVLGLFSAGTIIWMLFWMTARIELVERSKSQALVEQRLEAVVDRLRAATEDYAYWTLAYELVTQQDTEALFSNIGSGAVETDLFDQIFLLAPDGTLLNAYDGQLGVQAHPLFEPEGFQPILNALRETDPADTESVSAFADTVLGTSAITAAWITPDNIANGPVQSYPIMIATKQLNGGFMAALDREGQLGLATLRLTDGFVPLQAAQNGLIIQDFAGAPLATLTWEVVSAGQALRRELLPAVLAISFLVILICGGATFHFRCQQRRLEQATQIACTDQLTGLLNRAGLVQHMQGDAPLRHLHAGHLGAMYVDLDKFKLLNDTYGHNVGDIALRVAAERLQAAVGSRGTVARLGGDEFVCVICDPEPESAAVQIGQQFLDTMKSAVVVEGASHVLRGSVGVATGAPGTQWETLLSRSDTAMYWAKEEQADYPVVYCKSMYDAPVTPTVSRRSA